MCAPSPNSCPAKRAKTTGDANPSKRDEVREKISAINKKLFAPGAPIWKSIKQTNLDRYGVEHAASNPDVYAKTVKARKENNSYKYHAAMNGDAANKKRKETRIKKGYDIDPSLLSEFARYEQEVDRLTAQTYKKYKHIINPDNLKRGRTKSTKVWQLDHKFSKVEGFKKNIPAAIIAHCENLQMLTMRENISKGSQCAIELHELLLKIIRI